MTKPPLELVNPLTNQAKSPRSLREPLRNLGEAGLSLWKRVMSEYAIEDCGGIELLALACQALDRAESLRKQIDQDGEVIRARGMIKSHPSLRDELQNRAFVAKTLTNLGLNYEAIKPVGRPGGRSAGVGWRPENGED